ncbi:MAG: hypothetical protein CMD31_11710 [Flavobacteriales bacterium]|nr:hypothetical protein [Flavobacteriales bacterium]|tara:strand:+ start:31254 stop:32366 length:1113 start_codon:yes stop_codon:yes gene_type:complete
MKLKFLFLLFYICFNKFSQAKDITLILSPDTILSEIGFSCLKVIDKRDFKDNIGVVSRGLGKNNTQIHLSDNFEAHLTETINKLIPENNTPSLLLVFHNLKVSENIGTMNQYGYCDIEIEFLKQIDTLLYSLGTISHSVYENSFHVETTHNQRVLQALQKCLMKFNNTDWKKKSGILIEDFEKEMIFDYKNVPPKGVYFSYTQMIRKSPLNSIDFKVVEAKQTKKLETYSIDFENKINTKLIQFISDGENIYIQTTNNQYLKSKYFGKYIYFYGRVPITTNSDPTIYLFVGLVGGLTGGIVFAAFDDGVSTNTSIKGAVLDTEKGTINFVTDRCLYEITKPYPEILKEYRYSNRKITDKEDVIIKLNSKY